MSRELIHEHLLKSGLWPADALKKLQVTSLTGGTNLVFLVSDHSKAYVIKIPKPAAKALIDRQSEYEASQLTTQAGINLGSCYFDLASGVNISPYQPASQILTPKLLQQTGIWQTCADLLRNLHYHLPGAFSKNINIFTIIEFYQQQTKDKIPADLSKLLKDKPNLGQFREEFAAWVIPLSPCHNDPILSNFLLTATQKIYLIDWEYAGNNDPCWDLANFITDAGLSFQQEQAFLSYYFQRTPTPIELRRVAVYKILSNYLWTLWCILMGDMPNAYRRATG